MSDVDVTLGPGRYFLGDISWALTPDQIREWKDSGRPNGEIEIPADGKTEVGYKKVVVCATDSGNGTFCDFGGKSYVVKDYNIGIVPEALWDLKESVLQARGRIITVKDQVVFDVEDGIFWITADDNETIEIDTEADYDDDDADWEEDEGWDDEDDEWPMDEDEQP